MRRRRQKNNLLPKMIGLAVLINAILLPILAQFGVFKSIGHSQRLTPIELVKAPPPEKRPPPPKKAKKQVVKAKPPGRKAASRTALARRAAPGPPPVRVVAGGAGGTGSGGDAGITTSDDKTLAPPAPNPGGAGQTALVTPPTLVPIPVTPPAPVTPEAVKPALPPPAPHIPVITSAAPVAQPRPSIPDDLRDADLNAAFEGLFTVRPDGTATVKMVSSTGNPALDGLALDAAKHWTFRPATRDGQPVESYLRLRVEFDVSS